MSGEIGVLAQQSGRRFPCKLAEVSNQVRLVEVSGPHRGVRPPRFRTFQSPKNTPESLHPAEELWRDTHRSPKTPFELANAQAGAVRHLPDTHRSARRQFTHRRRHQPILRAGALRKARQDAVQRREAIGQRARFFDLVEFHEQPSGDVVKRYARVRQLAHGHSQELASRVRMKPDAHHPHRAGRPKHQRAGYLPEEKTPRLGPPDAFGQAFIGLAQIQDQLRAAIGDNSLNTRIRVEVFEYPVAAHEPRHCGIGCDLLIAHGSVQFATVPAVRMSVAKSFHER